MLIFNFFLIWISWKYYQPNKTSRIKNIYFDVSHSINFHSIFWLRHSSYNIESLHTTRHILRNQTVLYFEFLPQFHFIWRLILGIEHANLHKQSQCMYKRCLCRSRVVCNQSFLPIGLSHVVYSESISLYQVIIFWVTKSMTHTELIRRRNRVFSFVRFIVSIKYWKFKFL